jgi:hypothetical protein
MMIGRTREHKSGPSKLRVDLGRHSSKQKGPIEAELSPYRHYAELAFRNRSRRSAEALGWEIGAFFVQPLQFAFTGGLAGLTSVVMDAKIELETMSKKRP